MSKRLRILLIEDNPADVEIARLTLEESGINHVLQIAEDGEEALSLLVHKKSHEFVPPDLILLDINLPKLSGREVLQSIKHNAELKDVPVMVLTSSSAKNDVNDFYKLGADYYLIKPLGLEDFKNAINEEKK